VASERRGLLGIKSIGALLDSRRARTPGGAFLELSSLANEKVRLQKELDRWTRRRAEIEARLVEIRVKEEKLATLTGVPNLAAVVAPGQPARRVTTPAVERPHRVRTTEIEY
jgi:hypothetical protein